MRHATLLFLITGGNLSPAVHKQERLKQEEELTESVFPGYRGRKAQFEYRLKRLREQVQLQQLGGQSLSNQIPCVVPVACIPSKISLSVLRKAMNIARVHGILDTPATFLPCLIAPQSITLTLLSVILAQLPPCQNCTRTRDEPVPVGGSSLAV